MKKIYLALGAFALCLIAALFTLIPLSASQSSEGYLLYFPADVSHSTGPALRTELLPWPDDDIPPSPIQLLETLLDGPQSEDLTSPFPSDVMVRYILPSTGGYLSVHLSEHYSGLTNISLTLADYCIVLTLSQVEGVNGVEISSVGQPTGYRSHVRLSPDEVLFPLENSPIT